MLFWLLQVDSFMDHGRDFGATLDARNDDDDDGDSDSELTNDSEAAADALLGFKADITEDRDDRQQVNRHIPESAVWVCRHLNRKRAVGPVQKKQWQFFEQHYTGFQNTMRMG
jgi:hypothetical protein